MEEVKALGRAVQEVEMSVQASDVDRNFDDIISNIDKDKETKKAPEEENKPTIGANRTLMIWYDDWFVLYVNCVNVRSFIAILTYRIQFSQAPKS